MSPLFDFIHHLVEVILNLPSEVIASLHDLLYNRPVTVVLVFCDPSLDAAPLLLDALHDVLFNTLDFGFHILLELLKSAIEELLVSQ